MTDPTSRPRTLELPAAGDHRVAAAPPSTPNRRRRRVVGLLVVCGLLAAGGVFATLRRPSEFEQQRRTLVEAARLIDEGKHAEARPLLEAALAARPGDATALRLAALSRLGAGDGPGAQPYVDRLRQVEPKHPGIARLSAELRLAAGDARGALDAAREAPEPAARIVEARAWRALGRPAAASAAFARGPVPDDLSALSDAVTVELALGAGAFPGARRHAARAAELAAPLGALARARLARSRDDPAATLGAAIAADADPAANRENVRAQYDKAVARERDGVAARMALAGFLTRSGKQDAALDVLLAAQKSTPGDAPLRASVAGALLAAGRAREAHALAVGGGADDVRLLVVAGDAATAMSEPERAAVHYDAALALRPGDAALLVRRHAPGLARLVVSLSAGRDPAPDELAARAALETALKADPDAPDVLGWAARVAQVSGTPGDAWPFARRRMEIAPDDPDARALAWVIAAAHAPDAELRALADALVAADDAPEADFRIFAAEAAVRGRRDVALRLSSAAVVRRPADEELRLLHARALLAAGHAAAAEGQIVDALGKEPRSAAARELLAWIRASQGRTDEAVAALAASTDAQDVVTRVRILTVAGRPADAEAAARAALARTPGDPLVLRTLAEVLLASGRADEAAATLTSLGDAATVADLALLGHALGASSVGSLTALRERMAALPDSALDVLRLDARVALAAGQREVARTTLDRYLALRPSDVQAWIDAAALCDTPAERPAAIQRLRRATELAPMHPRARRDLAALLYADAAERLGARDMAGARAALEETTALAPDWTPARRALAVTLFEQALPDLSDAECRRVLARAPGDPVARLVMALTRRSRGDLAGALTDIDGLVAEQPENAALRVQRGLLRLQAERTEEAKADFEASGATGADAQYGLAGCAVLEGRTDDALRHARRAVELAPDASFTHRALGEALALSGDADGAVAAFDAAAATSRGDALASVAAARILVAAKRWDDALARLDRLAVPGDDALLLRGEALAGKGDRKAAADAFERAGATHPRALVRAAVLAEDLGDVARAVHAYRSALASGVRDRDLRNHLAVLLMDTPQKDEALALLEGLVAEDPKDAAVANNLAVMLTASAEDDADPVRRRASLARAIDLAERARALLPESPDVADTLGWAKFLAGDVDGARALLEEALLRGAGADASYHMGVLEMRGGDRERGALHLRKALRGAEKTAWTDRAQKLLETR